MARRPTGPGPTIGLAVAGLACLGAGLALGPLQQPRVQVPDLGSEPAVPVSPAPPGPSSSPSGTASALPASLPWTVAASPRLLDLPTQRVRAHVVPIGLQSGSLDLPDDPHVVGWWAAGAAPGDSSGSAVLAAHLDSASRGIGVLTALTRVLPGDPMMIADAAGDVHRYSVDSRRTYAKADLPDALFARSGPPRLVLITCAGHFDARTGHYDSNLVVVARPDG
ncbi:MAG TPA: class F sortase [Kineosporiaceae bacterium]